MSYDQIILDQVDSTMAEALRRLPEINASTWIMARRQSHGRGRRGNAWNEPDGNFAATLVMRPACSPSEAALRSIVAANALYDVVAKFVDEKKLALKWPNDVLLNGGKLAGILLESSGASGQVDWLSIGIGVNLTSAPEVKDASFPPVHLQGLVGQEEFLDLLNAEFTKEERCFQDQGFEPIRIKWLSRAAKLGEVITARTAKEELTGTFETVDEDGQLVLLTAKGRIAVPAADVYF